MTSQRPPRLVVTGGSGFIGRCLVRQLAAQGWEGVTVLSRNADRVSQGPHWPSGWRSAAFDAGRHLGEVSWGDATVVHLAAATGRASPAELQRVNVEGTRQVLKKAADGGARHFILVSSIAAGFRDRRWYPYADSKVAAEALVREGPMSCTIVRPTLVFGEGSAVQRGLALLAGLPLPILFGNGGVRTQPVGVDDVAAALIALALEGGSGEVVELGGADVVTLAELYGLLRTAGGQPTRGMLRLPALPIRVLLRAIEPVLRPVLPLTSGQLAAFVNDSVATPTALAARVLRSPAGLATLLAPRA